MRPPAVSPAAMMRSVRLAVTRNLGLKGVSLALAFGLWYFVHTERTVERPLLVPVQLQNIPATLTVTDRAVDYVDLRVVGPSALVSKAEKQVRLLLDLEGVRPGRATFTMEPELFSLPRGVRVVRVNPTEVSVTLERVAEGEVPVRPRVEGSVPTGYVLRGVEVTPANVHVTGARSIVDSLAAIETAPIDVSAALGTQNQEVALVVPHLVTVSPARVTATIRVDEVIVVREIRDVPVQVTNVAGRYKLSPETVALTVKGPEQIVTGLSLPPGTVKVDGDGVGRGVHKIEAIVELPEGVELVAQEPKTLRLTIGGPAAR